MRLSIIFIFLQLGVMSAIAEVTVIKGTVNKTTSLVFPSAIVHVDLGLQNDFIAIDVDENVPNLLKLRMSTGFASTITNMLVVTKDEYVYSFEILYSDSLENYVYIIKQDMAVNAPIITPKEVSPFMPDSLNDDDIITLITNNDRLLTRAEISKKGKMTLLLKNIFVQDNDLYISCKLNNESNLKYIIDFYNLFMTSNLKKSLKGTTSQDIQVEFHFLGNKILEIPAGENRNVIIRLKKFTLEDDKIGVFEIYEKDGGRHLRIKISNTELLDSIKL